MGGIARIPDWLVQVQRKSAQAARNRDNAMEDAVAQFVQDGREGFTLAEVASAVKLIPATTEIARLQMREQKRLAGALRAMGYESSGKGAARIGLPVGGLTLPYSPKWHTGTRTLWKLDKDGGRMTMIEKLREAAENHRGIRLTIDEVVALLDEIEDRIGNGPAPIINVRFGSQEDEGPNPAAQ